MLVEIEEIETYVKKTYPAFFNFLDATLWPDVDGFNPIELLHRIAFFGHPGGTKMLIGELKAITSDEKVQNDELSMIFNKEDIDHPYQVVNKENAKDFCFSMHESPVFIVSLKKQID